jgi:hypothetical protein
MTADPVMPTGLFAGRRVSRLPTAYLRLQLGTAQLPPYLRAAIGDELQRRIQPQQPQSHDRPRGPDL